MSAPFVGTRVDAAAERAALAEMLRRWLAQVAG
jgi:hypothetical protein